MASLAGVSGEMDGAVGRLLRGLRGQLGLDAAVVSELGGCEWVVRYVDSDLVDVELLVGATGQAEGSCCHYVAAGLSSELLPEAGSQPVSAGLAVGLAVTGQGSVGTHLSVPIRFADGSVYGTLCGLSLDVRDDLDERALAMLRLLADVVAGYVEERADQRGRDEQRRDRLCALIAGPDLEMVYQPIVALDGLALVGVEALARFPTLGQGPAEVFSDAWLLGLGTELERRAIRAAVAQMPAVPDRAYLAVNASPATLTAEALCDDLDGIAPDRLVVEVTEHAAVSDYAALLGAFQRLGDCGARLAIDDAGAGFSGLQQILRLSPDIIKIDAALVRDVDICPAKQAMISALMTFAGRTRTGLVAEGIETQAELDALRVLGVPYGQGYHIGQPQPGTAPATQPANNGTRVPPPGQLTRA